MATQETVLQDPPPVRTRRGWTRYIVIALVLLLATSALAYWRSQARYESTDDAQIDGRVYPISSRIGGTVSRLLVEDNQLVQAGTVLVQIDPRDYDVAVARAKADLAEAEARLSADTTQVPITSATTSSVLSSLQAGVAEQKANLAAAEQAVAAARARRESVQALVRQAAANAERAAKDLERMKSLVAKEEISQQQYDASVAASTALHAQVDSAEAQVREAEQGIRVAQAQLAQQVARVGRAEADVRAALTGPQQVSMSQAQARSQSAKVLQMKAALAQTELNLEHATVKAPVSGIVSQKNVEIGVVVAPGQPLLAIVPLDQLWVTANFKESQIARMRPGQPVSIEVDTFKGRDFKGRIQSIAAATGARFSILPPENATGNFVKVVQRIPVKIFFEPGQDPEHLLRPGMSATPTVDTR
jgi:membrane fusion protein, multidrug efflux system